MSAGADPLLHATVYLGAAVVMVPIAARLGLGSVLGYLIAGVLVGPGLLDLVGDTEQVQHFAEFGVVVMLFLVGLELQPRVLWRMKSAVLGLGGLQVTLSALAIAGAALVLGQDWRAALAIGLALALSSTAIVMQSLKERGLSGSAGGRAGFAVLLMQDVAVIPILALLPLLAVGDHGAAAGGEHGHDPSMSGWVQALLTVGAVAAVILAGKLAVNPLLRLVASTGIRELFSASALLLVVGIAVLMSAVGLSPALGTFLAGVVLADSEFRHELEADLEPFKGLLLGLFFITVGAGIDLGLLAAEPLVIAGLVVGLVVVKAAICWGLARAWRLPAPDRWTVGLALAQGGEFAFVLFAVIGGHAIVAAETLRLLTVTVALSMAITPLLFILLTRLVHPRYQGEQVSRPADDPGEHPGTVIVAGFGRYGQVVGRMLKANGFEPTVLDLDHDSIRLLRRHGLSVFYGDAARGDLLHAAGIDAARLLVIAVDEPERATEIAHLARHHHPELPIVVRATDAHHAQRLIDAGASVSVPEATAAGVELGEAALRQLGYGAWRAARAGRRFRAHERETHRRLHAACGDDGDLLSVHRERVADLERLLALDDADPLVGTEQGWDPPVDGRPAER